MFDGNTATDCLIDRGLAAADVMAAKSEAIEAKAELIETALREGRPFRDWSLDEVIDAAMTDYDALHQAIKSAYLYGNAQFINVVLDAEITRIANRLAPAIVQESIQEGIEP